MWEMGRDGWVGYSVKPSKFGTVRLGWPEHVLSKVYDFILNKMIKVGLCINKFDPYGLLPFSYSFSLPIWVILDRTNQFVSILVKFATST